MRMSVKVEMDSLQEILAKRGLEERGRVQQYIDSEVLSLCEPYVPKDQGAIIDSGNFHTDIGSGEVIYDTPYARRWYYEPANFQEAPKRGNYWFERMLNEGGRKAILKGAVAISGAKEG